MTKNWIHVGRSDFFGGAPRRAVCKRCHVVMDDGEPMSGSGEFFHKTTHKDGTRSKCKNAGRPYYLGDPEIEPFMRKRTRRAARRAKTS